MDYTIHVDGDLKVKIFHKNDLFDEKWHKDVIRNGFKLTSFSQLSKLIARCEDPTNNEKFHSINYILKSVVNTLISAKTFIDEFEVDFEYQNVLDVVIDQIVLMTTKKRKCSINTILCAYMFYLQSCSSYEIIRNKKILILPHKSVLIKLASHQDINVINIT